MSLEVSSTAEGIEPVSESARILVVLPVHDESPPAIESLERTLASVAAQAEEPADVVLTVPPAARALRMLARSRRVGVVDDPGAGLAVAVNIALASALPRHRYVSWLTEDDELLPGALSTAAARLDSAPDAALAYGDCRYVDCDGEYLYTPHATPPTSWRLLAGVAGPARPAVLIRLSAWRAVGDLDVTLRYAMDLDLLLRLRAHGRFVPTGRTLAVFHRPPGRVPRADASAATTEAASVRRRYLPPALRPASRLLGVPQQVLGRRAPSAVQRAAALHGADH